MLRRDVIYLYISLYFILFLYSSARAQLNSFHFSYSVLSPSLCLVESEELHAQSSKRADVVFVDRFPGVLGPGKLCWDPNIPRLAAAIWHHVASCGSSIHKPNGSCRKCWLSLSRGSWNLHCQVMGTGITRNFDPMILKQPGVRTY